MEIAKSLSKVDEVGDGSIDIVDIELKRSLALTAADLRFVDFVLKEMEANAKSPSIFFRIFILLFAIKLIISLL